MTEIAPVVPVSWVSVAQNKVETLEKAADGEFIRSTRFTTETTLYTLAEGRLEIQKISGAGGFILTPHLIRPKNMKMAQTDVNYLL